ncbi:glycosyltransferase family 4 protein [Sulfurospirillum sp. T05]|uniref:Glycosyltransferase family 4 protein n=1 Tax=Sulfurospirillum tamanense TaxID=2813362 RepID=A0ABS2WSM4_9BACT|nr:glycosyltransferase family 4 protein [Sulfurospirillum tamanensis]MBN2964664.1 glycosyltransferase family 4 protein [Sulfurospirillum tamanensis]
MRTCKEDVRILEVCLSPDLGGLELYVLRCAKHFKTSMVIAKDSKLAGYLEEEDLKYEKIGRKNPFALAKIIDTCKADVLHVHWTKDLSVAVFAKLFSHQKPKIIQTRHMHMTRFKDDMYHRFLYRYIDGMIAVTKRVHEQIEAFVPQSVRPKVFTSYIGVETPQMLTPEAAMELRRAYGLDGGFVVGIFGRIEPAKGQHVVLEAAERLRQQGLEVKTLVVGGAMDKAYEKKLQERFCKDVFVGFSHEVGALMQACDCVVLATEKETFGLVLVEAMHAGVSVLGSNSGGPQEIIEDGVSGVLFEPMSAEDLAKKLAMVLGDGELRSKLAQGGQMRAKACFDAVKQFREVRGMLKNYQGKEK